MLHDRPEIIPLLIAVVCGALAAFLAGRARIQMAVSRESHAVAAMKDANEKLLDANKDIVALRRQISHLASENEELNGRLFLAEKPVDLEWEATQTLLDKAAQKLDATLSSAAAAAPPPPKSIKRDNGEMGKLTFRKGPMELDASDFDSEHHEASE